MVSHRPPAGQTRVLKVTNYVGSLDGFYKGLSDERRCTLTLAQSVVRILVGWVGLRQVCRYGTHVVTPMNGPGLQLSATFPGKVTIFTP